MLKTLNCTQMFKQASKVTTESCQMPRVGWRVTYNLKQAWQKRYMGKTRQCSKMLENAQNAQLHSNVQAGFQSHNRELSNAQSRLAGHIQPQTSLAKALY